MSYLTGDLVAQHVAAYVPRHVSAQVWAAISTGVRVAATGSCETLPTVRVALPSLAAFGGWLHSEGHHVTPAEMADPVLIERYIQVGMPARTEATRATRRATLRRLADRLAPPVTPPLERIAYRRARAPYTQREIAEFFAMAAAQPTGARRHSMTAVLTLGLGCGLHRQDLAWVRGGDVHRDRGVVTVHVSGGPRTRQVVALEDYAQQIVDCARRTVRDDLLIGGMFPGRVNVTAPTLDRMINDRSVSRVVPTRLRATWLVTHLNLRTPYSVLLPAAGMVSSRTLDDLLEYANPVPADEAISLLRGVSA